MRRSQRLLACFRVSGFGYNPKDAIKRRSLYRNWRYDYSPMSILPTYRWRLPIMKPGGMRRPCHFSSAALHT